MNKREIIILTSQIQKEDYLPSAVRGWIYIKQKGDNYNKTYAR
jgi:hypothetical protein